MILCLMISVVKLFLSFVLISSLLFGCKQDDVVVHLTGKTMGTSYNVKFVRNSTVTISNKEISKFINLRLQAVNLSMSTYISQSELSKFNRFDAHKWFKISKDFHEVLLFSYNLAKSTKGLYDPTIGPLVNLWGFGPNGASKVPSSKDIRNVLRSIGYKNLFFSKSFQIKKSIKKLYLDLSSSAKGFGVDKVSEMLEKLTITNYMVEIGGELRTNGSKNSKPWVIGIEFPNNETPEKSLIKMIESKDWAIATSGNYRNFFKSNGKQYSHIINSQNGRPVQNNLLSVTVIVKRSCMKADGIATALMAMGKKRAINYAKLHKIATYLIYSSNKSKTLNTYYSKAFIDLDI